MARLLCRSSYEPPGAVCFGWADRIACENSIQFRTCDCIPGSALMWRALERADDQPPSARGCHPCLRYVLLPIPMCPGWTLSDVVGAAGFEPTTCSTQNCRATRLRYTPMSQRTMTPDPSSSRSSLLFQHDLSRKTGNRFGRIVRQSRLRYTLKRLAARHAKPSSALVRTALP